MKRKEVSHERLAFNKVYTCTFIYGVSQKHFTMHTMITYFFYLTLCTFSFEIKESSLSDTRFCITTLVIEEWRKDARDLCRTTLSWHHIIGMRENHINVSNVNKVTLMFIHSYVSRIHDHILIYKNIVSIFLATLRSTFL